MADTAKRLVGPTQLTAAAATKYTVPGATTTTILHIIAVNTSSTDASDLTISIGADAAGKRIIDQQVISPLGKFEMKGFIVMTAAEILQAYASSASTITLTISGVETT